MQGPASPKCFVGAPQPKIPNDVSEPWSSIRTGQGSEVDLIRGEGTLFGSRQSGMPDLKVAKLLRDVDVLVEARREAFAPWPDPTLKRPDHRPLRRDP